MKNIIKKVYERIEIQEDITVIDNILKIIYLKQRVSTKELAQNMYLPIPLVSAIKKELIKQDLVEQTGGVILSELGKLYVEKELGFENIDLELYQELLRESTIFCEELKQELNDIYAARPEVDVELDQAKATVETALNKALLCLKYETLINSNIVCLGDDDLVSVALGFILKKLYGTAKYKTTITVFEKDMRIISYLETIAKKYDLKIVCHEYDFEKPLPIEYRHCYDCIFVDPPYTLNGLKLFVSRAISLLKPQQALNIYLAYAHRSPSKQLLIQECLMEFKLVIDKVEKAFNVYEGASILGNVSQLMVVKTTLGSQELIASDKENSLKIYTYDYNKTLKTYQCSLCQTVYRVGKKEKFKTIEMLKQQACQCGNNNFRLLKREKKTVKKEKLSNGQHLILDLYGCKQSLLDDKKYLEEMMLHAAKLAQASVVKSEFHHFNPYGISGVIIIKESHLTIHTWPEYNYAAIDIFTCGDTLGLDVAAEYIEKQLEAYEVKKRKLSREVHLNNEN